MTRQSEENLSRRNRLGKKDYNARNKKRLKKRLAITKILFTTIVIGLCGRITYLKLEKGNDYEKQVLETQKVDLSEYVTRTEFNETIGDISSLLDIINGEVI